MKLFNKIAIAFTTSIMAIGVGVGLVTSKDSVASAATPIEFTLTNADSVTKDGVTVSFAAGSGTKPAWYAAGLRLYTNNTMTISSSSDISNISIDWEKQGSKAFAPATANTGTYKHPSSAGTGTWTGTAKTVVFTVSGSGQLQLNTFSVTLAGSSDDDTVPVTGVSLDKESITATVGDSPVTLTATVTPDTATNKSVSWSSSNESVATVANGVVTFVGAGNSTITVTTEDGNKTDTCSVTVSTPSQPEPAVLTKTVTEVSALASGTVDSQTQAYSVTGTVESIDNANYGNIKLSDGTTTVVVYGSTNDSSKLSWNGSKYVWTSSQGGFAPLGILVGDTVTIKAIAYLYTKSGSTTVELSGVITNVEHPVVSVTGVSLDKESATIAINGSITLVATIAPATASNKNVTWTSSNTSVATVANGVVTAIAAGTTTITVITEDGNFTDTCAITVEEAAPITGLIASGKYYIKHGSNYMVANGTSSPTPTTSKAQATVFDFTLVDQDTYEIKTGDDYLYCISNNSGLRVGSTKDTWVISNGTLENGSYNFKDTNNNRYICLYYDSNTNTPKDFRSYTSTTTNRKENTDVEAYVETNVTLSSIAVSGQTTTFEYGAEFVFGGTVTATYSDSSTADVTADAVFDGFDGLVTGEQTITVSYTEKGETKSTTYTITVNAGSGSYEGLIEEGTYYIKHAGYYMKANGASQPIVTEYAAQATEFTFTLVANNTYEIKAGDDYLYVSGNDNNCLRIGSTSDRWIISEGSRESGAYDFKDTEYNRFVSMYYDSGNPKDFRSYNSGSATNRKENTDVEAVGITPIEIELASISISGQTLSFNVGDTFSFGGTVTATYTDGTTKDVTSNATFTGYDLSTAGNQTVTVLYTEDGVTKTTEYTINVVGGSSSNEEYTIKWNNNGSDGSAEFGSSDALVNYTDTDSQKYVSSYSSISKAYKGKTGIKMGSSGKGGSFTINLSDDGQVKATSIRVGLVYYSATKSTTLTVATDAGSDSTTTNYSTLTEVSLNISGDITYMTISTKDERAYLSYVTVCYTTGGSSGGDDVFTLSGLMENNTIFYDDFGTLTIDTINPEDKSKYGFIMFDTDTEAYDYFLADNYEGWSTTWTTIDIPSSSFEFTLTVFAYADMTMNPNNGFVEQEFTITIIKPAALVEAIDNFATGFGPECDNGVTPIDSGDWETLAEVYAYLSADAKNYLKNGSYTVTGSSTNTEVTAEIGTHDKIAEFLAKYDYIVAKYGYSNFIGRSVSSAANTITARVDSNATFVILVSVLSFTTFGAAALFIKKKKEN